MSEAQYVKKIAIRNLRGVRECTVEDMMPLTVLTGPTGSGKSLVLEAIDYALGKARGSDLFWYEDGESPEIELWGDREGWRKLSGVRGQASADDAGRYRAVVTTVGEQNFRTGVIPTLSGSGASALSGKVRGQWHTYGWMVEKLASVCPDTDNFGEQLPRAAIEYLRAYRALASRAGGLVLLDNPEAGIDRRLLKSLVRDVLVAVGERGTQVILATHSSELVG